MGDAKKNTKNNKKKETKTLQKSMKNAKITIGLIGLLLIGLVSVRKEGKVQEAGLLLQNVEALATGESFPDGEIACFGDGSVDCPFTYLKVEVVYREE